MKLEYSTITMKNNLTPQRMLYFCGFTVLCVATAMNIFTKRPFESFIPYIKYIDTFVNCLCIFLCLILIIRPERERIAYILYFIESGMTTYIGFTGIGSFIFIALIITLFANGAFIVHRKSKIIILAAYWIIVTASLYPNFGLRPVLFEIALTIFYLSFFSCIYTKLKSKLSYLLPDNSVTSGTMILPPHGSELHLKAYGLSDRQIQFSIHCIKDGLTYEEIAKKYFVSISVVKKDMASACHIFGVKNRETLRILLLQYKFS